MKCSRAFPDLRSEFSQVIASAERTPSEIVVESEAFPGRKTPVRVTDWVLANAILGQLYSPYSLQPLPGRIRAISRGDKEALRSIVGADPSRNALLQRLAVWCNDEYPFENVDAIRRQRTAFAQFAGVDQSTVPIGACKAAGLDRPTEGSTDNTAISSEKPILIFAGQYDPTIPPSWISTMTEHLPNAYVAMFPSQAHGAGFNECGWTMMQSFLDSPTNTPDASCLLHERSLDFSGSSTGKSGNASGD
jgi:pimeloyl-ACP methyl ester carboxylesterase